MAGFDRSSGVLLADRWQGGDRVALISGLSGGKIQDLWLRPPGAEHQIGAIYRGRVVRRFDKNLALVDLGDGAGQAQIFQQNGLIPDVPLVQITADPVSGVLTAAKSAGKVAECSTEIKLTGRYLIHLPLGRDILVSKRLPGAVREELRQRFQQWGVDGGWIIRSSAAGIAQDQLAYEAGYLTTIWRRVMGKGSAEGLLVPAPALAITAITDYGLSAPVEMIVNDARMAQDIRTWCEMAAPDLQGCLHVDTGSPGPFELQDIDSQIDSLLDPVVMLDDGCSLVFETAAAMHVVDVNAGRQSQRSAFVNNQAVTTEIARQIRLRRLSGIILVDYLKMADEANRHQLVGLCRDAFAHDPVPTQIHGLSRLGLMEITRMRRWASFIETWKGFGITS